MAAVSAAPNPSKGFNPVTLTLSAMAATTAYNVVVVGPGGHTSTYPVVTNGSGAATCTHVPATGGSYTVNVYLANPVSAANTTFNSSGSST
jgi:hypothetical protein